jgi:hypothetical protein
VVDKIQARASMELREFDFAAFRRSPWRDIRPYRKAVLATLDRSVRSHAGTIAAIILIGFLALCALGLGIGLVVLMVAITVTPGGNVGLGLAFVAFALFVAGSLYLCWRMLRRELRTLPRWRDRFRLAHFAQQNGLRYFPALANHSRPGSIFSVGADRRSYDVTQTTTVPFVELGNHQCAAATSGEERFRRWGYLMLDLQRNLPHLVLVSKTRGSRRRSRFPYAFRREQVLSLEGDFDQHFTLYAPKEYERDALYVFTPDVMARLIDEADGCHVEIVDHWMFVYEPGGFDFQDAETWQRVSRLVSTVGASMAKETFRYRDERIPAYVGNAVGVTGRRLRTAVPVGAVIVAVALLLFHLAPLLR